MVNAANPFGNGHLIPRGMLREPPSALGRAHVVTLHNADLVRAFPTVQYGSVLCSTVLYRLQHSVELLRPLSCGPFFLLHSAVEVQVSVHIDSTVHRQYCDLKVPKRDATCFSSPSFDLFSLFAFPPFRSPRQISGHSSPRSAPFVRARKVHRPKQKSAMQTVQSVQTSPQGRQEPGVRRRTPPQGLRTQPWPL